MECVARVAIPAPELSDRVVADVAASPSRWNYAWEQFHAFAAFAAGILGTRQEIDPEEERAGA